MYCPNCLWNRTPRQCIWFAWMYLEGHHAGIQRWLVYLFIVINQYKNSCLSLSLPTYRERLLRYLRPIVYQNVAIVFRMTVIAPQHRIYAIQMGGPFAPEQFVGSLLIGSIWEIILKIRLANSSPPYCPVLDGTGFSNTTTLQCSLTWYTGDDIWNVFGIWNSESKNVI